MIDVGPMMDIAPPMGGETPLESSLRIASQIVTQKVSETTGKLLVLCWYPGVFQHAQSPSHTWEGGIY